MNNRCDFFLLGFTFLFIRNYDVFYDSIKHLIMNENLIENEFFFSLEIVFSTRVSQTPAGEGEGGPTPTSNIN
jgi:hypothetical protein